MHPPAICQLVSEDSSLGFSPHSETTSTKLPRVPKPQNTPKPETPGKNVTFFMISLF